MNKDQAVKAAVNGAAAAVFVGCITLAVTSYALYYDVGGRLAIWNDPWNFLSAIFVFACAFGMHRKSRFAAIFILVFFILSRIIAGISIGWHTGLLFSLILLYFFAKAVQGTFVYHRIEKAENPDYKPPSRWYAFLVVPLGLVLLAAFAFGVLTATNFLPSTKVLAGYEMPQKDIQRLISEGIIDPGEKVEYFYSAGLFSILEDGNLLTDRRVISYLTNEMDEIELYELYFFDIRDFELIQKGSYLSYSVYQINSYDEDAWLRIFLSAEEGGDMRFINALRRKLKDVHNQPEKSMR